MEEIVVLREIKVLPLFALDRDDGCAGFAVDLIVVRSTISILLLLFSGAFGILSATEIWIAPQASVPPSPLNRAVDFLDMFKSDAPWRNAAQVISVFKLYGSYLEHAPQDRVNLIVENLKSRHISIAVEAGVINTPMAKPACGDLG